MLVCNKKGGKKMGTTEERLKELILSKYKSIREFTTSIDMPYSTFDSILKRGISNSNIANILKICSTLNIDAEMLASGEIVYKSDNQFSTIAAHKDGENFTPEELEKIEEYKKLLLATRPKE